MSIVMHPEVLAACRQELLRTADTLSSLSVTPPATGRTSPLTAAAVEEVLRTVSCRVRDLQELAGGLAALPVLLGAPDEAVAVELDRISGRRSG